MKPCLECGEPSDETRCDEHRTTHRTAQVGSARSRGYDAAWTRLSKRARKLSPFCAVCGATDDLQTDHLPSAWQRRAEGKTIRLADVRVLCRQHNVDAGSSRPEALAGTGQDADKRLREKAQGPSLSSHAGDNATAASLLGALLRDREPCVGSHVLPSAVGPSDLQDAAGLDLVDSPARVDNGSLPAVTREGNSEVRFSHDRTFS